MKTKDSIPKLMECSKSSAKVKNYCCKYLHQKRKPWVVWLSWLGIVPQNKGLLVQFLFRAHARFVGLVPGWGVCEATNWCFSLTLIFLSHSFSFPSPLSKNKFFFKKEERSQDFNNLTLHLKELEKRKPTKPKACRRKKILEIRVKINKKENTKSKEK